jgi:hypothetical protein
MGEQDLPAMMKYALMETQQKNLTLISHSTASMPILYGLTDSKLMKTYGSMVNHYIALAPVTYLYNSTSPWIKKAVRWEKIINLYFKMANIHEVMGVWGQIMVKVGCGLSPSWCLRIEGELFTSDVGLDDFDRFQAYWGHSPGGSSAKVLSHFYQNIVNQDFKHYDQGSAGLNKRKYGDSEGSIKIADLINGSVPVSLFVGTKDQI